VTAGSAPRFEWATTATITFARVDFGLRWRVLEAVLLDRCTVYANAAVLCLDNFDASRPDYLKSFVYAEGTTLPLVTRSPGLLISPRFVTGHLHPQAPQ
jgi:hypothetical protein